MTRALRAIAALVAFTNCAPALPPPAAAIPPPTRTTRMRAECIQHLDARKVGYSNVVKVGKTVYIAGQLPYGPQRSLATGDPERQVRQSWENVRAAVTAAGGTLEDVVATTTFITAREYGEAVNKVRIELFPTNAPTSTKVVVAGLACEGCLVEINAIAIVPSTSDCE